MNKQERKEYNREYMRLRREDWRANNLCCMCGRGIDREDRVTCWSCRRKAAQRGRKKRAGSDPAK